MPAPFRLVIEDGPTAARRETLPPAGRKCARSTRCAVHGWRIVGTPREGVNRDLPRPTSRRAHAALAPCVVVELMRRRRGGVAAERLARGPGNLGRALGLTRGSDGADLTRGPLWLSDLPPRRSGHRVAAGPRIGIRRGVERRWRFYLEGHPCVSGPRRIRPARGRPGQIPVDTLAGRSYY